LAPSRPSSSSPENRVKAGEKTELTMRQEKHAAAAAAAAQSPAASATAASTSRRVNW